MIADTDRKMSTQQAEAAHAGKWSGIRWAQGLFAAGLGGLACVGCCVVPLLVPLGLLTAGGVATATTGLTVVSAVLLVAAVVLWVWRARSRRVAARRARADEGCACQG